MEVRVGGGGRLTLPYRIRRVLGIKEGDLMTVEVSGEAILLKPKGISVKETWAVAGVERVSLEDVEEAAGREL